MNKEKRLKNLSSIAKSEELEENRTTRNFRVVRLEGKRRVEREIMFYNLDAVISVGYRVNSKKATQFRKWATKTLQESKDGMEIVAWIFDLKYLCYG